MKTILMSIQPKWCEKIFNREKTIDVRKTAPKEVPFKVYVYCTKGRSNSRLYKESSTDGYFLDREGWRGGDYEKRYLCGKVVGEFVCNTVENIHVDSEAFTAISKPSCLTTDELIEYCSGRDMYGLHITDLKVYDKPKELGAFKGYCNKKEKCYKDIVRHCNDAHFDWKCNSITRPPQSWQYVETPDWAEEE